MKRNFFTMFFFVLLADFVLFFTACPNPADDTGDGPTEEEFPFDDEDEDEYIPTDPAVHILNFSINQGETKYLALYTGEWLKNRQTAEWDIAFYGSRFIYTNSGETAAEFSSGGKGAVWHTEKIDFDTVTSKDEAVKDNSFYTPYNADTYRWVTTMEGTSKRRLNVMTYVGYKNENENEVDGKTEQNHFNIYFEYDKKQFYQNDFDENGNMMMPPNFTPTKRVYIIKHGDGVGHSKVQINQFARDSEDSIDYYRLIWKTF
jgi:hypothetical protein